MDIFDEVDMESSRVDDKSSEYILSSQAQDTNISVRRSKAIISHLDEVPLGADSGAAFARAARLSTFSGIDEKHPASKLQDSFCSSRRVKARKPRTKFGTTVNKPNSDSDDSSKSRRKVQQESADAPLRFSGRFTGDSRSKDGNDLKLNGWLPETYEVDMIDSDVTCELIEFGLVGGPQVYPNHALWKLPCW